MKLVPSSGKRKGKGKGKAVPLQARGAQRVPGVKIPRLRDNGPE